MFVEYAYATSDSEKSWRAALKGPEAKHWRLAMEEEMKSIRSHETFRLEPLPPGRKAIPCTWVLTKKKDANGQVVRYKARLVSLKNHHVANIDFNELDAPVAKFQSLRMMLIVAVLRGMKLFQCDIKTAFLNAKPDRDIYMMQPSPPALIILKI